MTNRAERDKDGRKRQRTLYLGNKISMEITGIQLIKENETKIGERDRESSIQGRNGQTITRGGDNSVRVPKNLYKDMTIRDRRKRQRQLYQGFQKVETITKVHDLM